MENLSSLKNQPKELFDSLYNELNEQEICISEVSNFFKKNDFFELAISALDDDCDKFHILIVLDKIGVVRDFEIKTLILFLQKLHKNLNEYLPFKTSIFFSQIAKLFPEKISYLIDALKSLDYKLIPEAIAALVNNNSQKSLNEKYLQSIEFINSNVRVQCLAGYAILENYISNSNFSEKDSAIKFLLELLNTKKEFELQRTVEILCDLSLTYSKLQKEIIKLRNKNDPYINYAISQFLFSNSNQINKTDYLKELFLTFTTISCEYKGIINNLALILLDMCKIEFDLFFKFITKWIVESDLRNNSISFGDIWSAFFSTLEFGVHASYIYSCYLLYDDNIYHKVAAEIILKTGIISKKSFYFENEIIQECTKKDIIFLCRKLLGYVYDINKLCELFDSILQVKIDDNSITKIIKNVFLRLGSEYGLPVLQFFKGKDISENTTLSEIYIELISLLENICKRNINMKMFPELFSTYEQKISVSRKIKDENKEIIKSVNSKSVVMNLVKTVTILYGKGSCYTMPDSTNSQSSNFSKIEHFFYLSKKDIFCPVDAEMERFFFRIAKRGEK